jgi:hypothetical protein
MTLSCTTCLTHRNSKPKEPLKMSNIPEYQWQVIATDLFAWDDQHFLIGVDYYGRFFEVFKLQNTTSNVLSLNYRNCSLDMEFQPLYLKSQVPSVKWTCRENSPDCQEDLDQIQEGWAQFVLISSCVQYYTSEHKFFTISIAYVTQVKVRLTYASIFAKT